MDTVRRNRSRNHINLISASECCASAMVERRREEKEEAVGETLNDMS